LVGSQGTTVPASSWLAAVLQRSAALFTPTGPADGEPRWTQWWLVAIVVAGAVLRFWGLGAIGLHREDEDTSALPVLHILQDGVPRFPSGMFYARSIVQSYLMAGTSWVFGISEWSLRLPSAVCGVALIILCYLLGRRFLAPVWNLAFTAVVAFLPQLITASQTARMYIFLLASLAGYALLIIRWERTRATATLCWAVIVMIVALQFHELAVFGAFLLFYPALVHGDARRLWQAGLAFVVVIAAYYGISEWVGMYFPQPGETAAPPLAVIRGPTAAALVPATSVALLLVATAAGALLAWLSTRSVAAVHQALAIAALTVAGIVCQALLRYHLALLLLIAAAVLVLRFGRRRWPLLLIGLTSAGIAVVQIVRLKAAGIGAVKNIAGVMLGYPSVWSYVRVADYSVVALAICVAGVVAALWHMGQRQRIPDFWWMFVLWGWIPLLLVGEFVWYPPPRYTTVALLPVLLTSLAVLQWCAGGLASRRGPQQRSMLVPAVAAIVASVAIINPVAFARDVNAGYRVHPDHVGAARFVQAQHPGPRDVILAEDVFVQTYYLGKVDYWLLGEQAAANFVKPVDGVMRDIYTLSRLMGSGEQLQRLIDDPDRGDIYIIGSGENQIDGRSDMRGASIQRLLSSGNLPLVFVGRDHLTRVWKIPARRSGS
jgi:Dolichyl-phosphate-mannose-protein mannosyltransferase